MMADQTMDGPFIGKSPAFDSSLGVSDALLGACVEFVPFAAGEGDAAAESDEVSWLPGESVSEVSNKDGWSSKL